MSIVDITQTYPILQDKHLYAQSGLSLVTIYDDNWFVRNDYDILSRGQRDYLQTFFHQQGFQQKTGKVMVCDEVELHFPDPKRVLALSSYFPEMLIPNKKELIAVTPTTFAEALFHQIVASGTDSLDSIKSLIDKCPYNIELLRDISYRTAIEAITKASFDELMRYQQQVIIKKFKRKKAL
ncbi:hypothetical protein DXX93_02260 [Thalassotalea euphylliae]|uniref:Uncharacterized protein n=1 Tax=Thalassotalea euphylliae TaxID=1655234 RepID=A0A3E0TLT4_9GAMM|nr:hypothetical protein [Thalassotalea euphylliae]REL25486.1 hypothetical protein DXX93_02260 [Thalassotalea euphylliae]